MLLNNVALFDHFTNEAVPKFWFGIPICVFSFSFQQNSGGSKVLKRQKQ